MTAQPETAVRLLDARSGMTSAWFEPQPCYDGRGSAAELLALAGHIGSTVALENPRYLAAYDGRWSPLEAWLRADMAERRAHDEALRARIEETVAALPQEQPAAPEEPAVRRTGRFGRRVQVPDPAPVLDERGEEALRQYNGLHDEYPDTDERPPGRHQKDKRRMRLRRRSR